MALNRRSFVGLGSLVACGTALNARALFAAVPQVLSGGLPLFENDEAVLAFVRSYSPSFRVVGASVLGRIRTSGLRALHVLVEIGDRERLHAALAGARFPCIQTHDNTLEFALADADVTIENLAPADFSARLAAMEKPDGNAFSHDALAYNPQTGELSDPFGARATEIRMVDKSFSGPAALDAALRGTLEAAWLRLPAGVDFAQWRNRVLGAPATAAAARKLASIFLQKLASLAEKLSASRVESFVRSRLIATSLKQTFGIDVVAAATEFKQRRSTAGAQITNAALWLSVLIEPEIRSNTADGAATTWIADGTRFEVLRSRAALAQAQTILQP